METPPALTTLRVRPFDPTGRLVRLAMLGFAFLLPFLSWGQAMGIALLALLFNAYLLQGAGWTAFGSVPARTPPHNEEAQIEALKRRVAKQEERRVFVPRPTARPT